MNVIPEIYGAAGTAGLPFDAAGTQAKKSQTDFAELMAAGIDETTAENSAEDTTVGDDVSQALDKAIEESLITSAINMAGGTDMSEGIAGSGLESVALAAAAEGGMSENMMAAMMLLMMMSMAGESSDASLLYPAIAALMSNMTSENGSGEERTVNTQVLGWDSVEKNTSGRTPFAGYDGDVRSAAQPNVSSSGAIIPTNAWVATTPGVVSFEGDRSPGKLREVLDQFNVETSARYTPYRNGATYCNIFVWDATNALGCEVPHYVDSVTGEPRYYPNVSGAYELDANGVHDWLVNKGAQYGWREVTAEEAQAFANEGYPVVAARKKSGGIGHVQMVCPSLDGAYDPARGPAITQAGSRNSNYTYQSSIYGSAAQSQVRYFVHN